MPIRRASDPDATQVIVDEPAPAREPPAGPPPPGAPLEEPPADRALWPWLLVLLVLVLAGVIGGWLGLRDRGAGKQSGGTTGVPAQTVASAPKARTGVATEPKVPRVVGLQAPAALAALRKAHLVGSTRGAFSKKPRNEILRQTPAPGITVAANSTVQLVVSKGPRPAPVPDVTGQSLADAIRTIEAQGLRANVVRVPSGDPAGQVIAQHPSAGSTAAAGSAVRVNVSAGASASKTPTTTVTGAAPPTPVTTPVTVPDVSGETLAAARTAIRTAGLVTEIRRVPNSLPKDTVVGQSPRPGTTARRGDHVFVTVSLGGAQPASSSGAPKPSVPNVVGEDQSTAMQDLSAAGFKAQVVDQNTTDQSQDGLVVRQDPASGRTAPARSSVTIYVGRFAG